VIEKNPALTTSRSEDNRCAVTPAQKREIQTHLPDRKFETKNVYGAYFSVYAKCPWKV